MADKIRVTNSVEPDYSGSGRLYRRHRATSTIGAFLSMMTVSTSIALGFLVVPGSAHFGVSTAQFLVYFSIIVVVSAIMASVVGRVVARFGPRLVMTLGGLIGGASLFAMAFAPNIQVVYLLAAVMGVGVASIGYLPSNTLIAGWHTHPRRGTVMGIVAAGAGFGGIVWGFLLPPIISSGGFQSGTMFIGVCFAATSTLPGIFLVKNPPKSGASGITPPARNAGQPGEARRARRGTLAGLGLVVAMLAIGSFLFSFEAVFASIQPAVYASVEIDSQTAGHLLSLFALCGMFSKPLIGYLHDKLGLRVLLIVLAVLFLLGLPVLALAMQLGATVLYPFLVIAAISMGVPTVILPLLAVEAVGKDRFPVAYGVLLSGFFIGLAVGTPAWGAVFDGTGSYVDAMYVSAGLGLVGLALLYVGVRRGRTRVDAELAATQAAETVVGGRAGDDRL